MELEIGQMWHFNDYVNGVWNLEEIGNEYVSHVTSIPICYGRDLKFVKTKADGTLEVFNFFESLLEKHATYVGMHYPSILPQEYPNRLSRVD